MGMLGNFLGGGGKPGGSAPASGGASNGIFSKSGAAPTRIRKSFFKNQAFRKSVENDFKGGMLNAVSTELVKGEDGKLRKEVVRKKFGVKKEVTIKRDSQTGKRHVTTERGVDKGIVNLIDSSTKSGQTVSSFKRGIVDERKLTSIGKDGKKTVYKITSDSARNRELKKITAEVFDSKGPTKKELEETAKLQERRRSANVNYAIRQDEEKYGKAGEIKSDRDGKAYLKNKLKTGDRKITAADIGVTTKEDYNTSAAQSTGGMSKNDQQDGGTASATEVDAAASIGAGTGVKAKEKSGSSNDNDIKDELEERRKRQREQLGVKGPGVFDNNLTSDGAADDLYADDKKAA